MKYLSTLLKSGLSLIATTGILLYSNDAIAAQSVVFTYGILRESVSVDDLTTFAQTGKASSSLSSFLDETRQNPQTVRNTLTREINVSPVILDRTLNSRIGLYLLDQVGYSIHTSSNQANRQALRSALVLSANGDNKVSLIEVIQKYPTSEVIVDGERLVRSYNQLSILAADLGRIFGVPTSSK